MTTKVQGRWGGGGSRENNHTYKRKERTKDEIKPRPKRENEETNDIKKRNLAVNPENTVAFPFDAAEHTTGRLAPR